MKWTHGQLWQSLQAKILEKISMAGISSTRSQIIILFFICCCCCCWYYYYHYYYYMSDVLPDTQLASKCNDIKAHAPETGTINWLHFFWRRFLVRVSCKSVTGFIWYQILAQIRTLFYRKPESSMHMTEMIIYDLLLFNLPLATIPGKIIAYTSANLLSTLLAANFIFGARNFHSRRIWYEKPVPKTCARKWILFMGPVPVMSRV